MGVFSWVPTAVARNSLEEAGSDIDVTAYVPTGDDKGGKEYTLYFSFMTPESALHPANIFWDPRLGLDYDESDGFCIGSLCGGAAIGLIAGIAIVAILVVLGVAVALRRRSGYQVVN